ncbi:MAG: hypothetical protein IKU34_05065 [Clostridia bacterium]|nr:hypothetical protein [Clostridia bacterium]
MMIAIIEALKLAMQGLPNIEMTSFLLILFTLHFEHLTLLTVPALILIEGTLYGFGLWWVMYLYAWPLLSLIAHLFRKNDSAFFWAIVSGAYGLSFGFLCSFPYFFIGASAGGAMMGLRQMLAWWISGIPFDLLHGAGNFVLMLALYKPVSSLLRRIPQITAR